MNQWTYPSNIRRWKIPGKTNPSRVQQLDPKNAMRVEKFGMTSTTMPDSTTTQPRKIHCKETRNTLLLLDALVDQQHVNHISMKLLSESCCILYWQRRKRNRRKWFHFEYWLLVACIVSHTERHIQDIVLIHILYCGKMYCSARLQLCDWWAWEAFSSYTERLQMTAMHQEHNNTYLLLILCICRLNFKQTNSFTCLIPINVKRYSDERNS